MPLPLRAGGKADPVGLHPLDHAARQFVACDAGAVSPKANCHLIQDDLIFDHDPWLLRELPGHRPRDPTIACDELCDPLPTKGSNDGPSGEATRAPGKFRHQMGRVPLTFGSGREVARRIGHRAPMSLKIPHDGVTAIIRCLQPFVTVARPGVCLVDTFCMILCLGTGSRPEAECAIDMDPGGSLMSNVGDLADRIDRTRVDLSCLESERRGDRCRPQFTRGIRGSHAAHSIGGNANHPFTAEPKQLQCRESGGMGIVTDQDANLRCPE